MDTYKPFLNFKLSGMLTFQSSQYEEYQNGQLIDSGKTTILVKLSPSEGEKINCLIGYNNLYEKLSSCSFDRCITLHDRLLMFVNPEVTNADIPVAAMLSSLIGYTRGEYYFDSIEPVVGSIYTENSRIVKMSFTMSNPERLIEIF